MIRKYACPSEERALAAQQQSQIHVRNTVAPLMTCANKVSVASLGFLDLPHELRNLVYMFYHPFLSQIGRYHEVLDICIRPRMTFELYDGTDHTRTAEFKWFHTIYPYKDAHGPLALMRICRQVWVEIKGMLRKPHYLFDLTNPHIYWSGKTKLYQRFDLDYLNFIPEPDAVVVVLITQFRDYAAKEPGKIIDVGTPEGDDILQDIIKAFCIQFDQQSSLRSMQTLQVELRGPLIKQSKQVTLAWVRCMFETILNIFIIEVHVSICES